MKIKKKIKKSKNFFRKSFPSSKPSIPKPRITSPIIISSDNSPPVTNSNRKTRSKSSKPKNANDQRKSDQNNLKASATPVCSKKACKKPVKSKYFGDRKSPLELDKLEIKVKRPRERSLKSSSKPKPERKQEILNLEILARK